MPACKASFATVLVLAAACVLAPAPAYASDTARDLKQRVAEEQTVQPAMLDTIATWLAENFDLRPASQHPRIVFVPPTQLVAMRYKGTLPNEWREDLILDPAVRAAQHRGVAAIYNDALRTIFLPHGWSGATAAEQSILVHEMVHHLQNLAGEKFDCAEERERLAYRAQNEWLSRTGKDLEGEFGLDPMTLLLASRCMH